MKVFLFRRVQHGSWGQIKQGVVRIRAASEAEALALAKEKQRRLPSGDLVSLRLMTPQGDDDGQHQEDAL